MDSNGYNDSIFSLRDTCFICGRGGDLARHEVFYGIGNRAISKKHGFWVTICPLCHETIHLKTDDGEMDEKLKKKCYRKYCETHSKEDFYKLIGRYYDD